MPETEPGTLEWRLRQCTPVKYRGATAVKYPRMYDSVQVATYRPRGTVAEVWTRIEQERERR